ncbi:MAG: hypothetical protein CVU46_01920 [Chloroflexi bacterium HGW-Chloroflexi-8]|nr:MAG: hypothetical protein CVU46_01920 [Chloroflexi bacterium HGW-Chloroflexi-8]
MLRILHFSDAHIDIAAHGKKDPSTGLPYRVQDFLIALDKIVDYAINSPVDLVIFTGDAYRDRTPSPTYQREWGKRIIRLSKAAIPTILMIGNHDLSPTYGRAHALQEFDTLSIPYVHVIDKPMMLGQTELENLPVQIIAFPWLSSSAMAAMINANAGTKQEINNNMEFLINKIVENWIKESNPDLPLIFAAHASVQGAVFGGERNITLGNDYVLPGSLVRNSNFDYVALGHIHKAQNLNEDSHPPVIYAGSIERVDFGEIEDQKYFVVTELVKGKTSVNWIALEGRNFIDNSIDLRKLANDLGEGKIPDSSTVMEFIRNELPDIEEIADSVARLTLTYPLDWEPLIDNHEIHQYYKDAIESQIIHKPQANVRLRLGDDESISSLSPINLLEKYLLSEKVDQREISTLQELATKIIYNQDDPFDLEAGS